MTDYSNKICIILINDKYLAIGKGLLDIWSEKSPTVSFRIIWLETIGDMKKGEMSSTIPRENIIKIAEDNYMVEIKDFREKHPEYFV